MVLTVVTLKKHLHQNDTMTLESLMENEGISVEIEIIKGCYFSSKSLTFVNVKRKLV